MIAWFNFLVINYYISGSINVFANFASMFATRFVVNKSLL